MEAEILKEIIEIKDILSTGTSEWMPALFTLLGVFVAGLLQYLNNKLNLKVLSETKELEIRSDVISKQRQQWMDQIRSASTEFLIGYDMIVSDIGINKRSQEEHFSFYKSANEKATLISLMLNQEKPEQKKLC